jgi:GNAT superfamily N-acetyltransferase
LHLPVGSRWLWLALLTAALGCGGRANVGAAPGSSVGTGSTASSAGAVGGSGAVGSVFIDGGTIGLPAASASKLFGYPERLLQAHMHAVVAYDGATPISAALAFLSHGIGGAYWVGTVPAGRGRGVAAHCTQAVTNWCFEQGARAVALQASRQGEPIYRALGFTEFTRYPWFLCMPS